MLDAIGELLQGLLLLWVAWGMPRADQRTTALVKRIEELEDKTRAMSEFLDESVRRLDESVRRLRGLPPIGKGA